jgi:hypothetical protein
MNTPIIIGIFVLAVVLLRAKAFREVKTHWYFWSFMVASVGLISIIAGLLRHHQALAFRGTLEQSDPQVVVSTVDLLSKLSIVQLCVGPVFILLGAVGIFIGTKWKDTRDAA